MVTSAYNLYQTAKVLINAQSDHRLCCLQTKKHVFIFDTPPPPKKKKKNIFANNKSKPLHTHTIGQKASFLSCGLYFTAHTEKMHFVRFHPLARDIIVTSVYDLYQTTKVLIRLCTCTVSSPPLLFANNKNMFSYLTKNNVFANNKSKFLHTHKI